MVSRNHHNRSEHQKGHDESRRGAGAPDAGESRHTHSGHETSHKGDGGGGAPPAQGQGQANRDVDNEHQNRGHGGRS